MCIDASSSSHRIGGGVALAFVGVGWRCNILRDHVDQSTSYVGIGTYYSLIEFSEAGCGADDDSSTSEFIQYSRREVASLPPLFCSKIRCIQSTNPINEMMKSLKRSLSLEKAREEYAR